MPDFSQLKFSKDSQEPTYLPNRIYLPSGKTRYKWSITQEEISSCGYVGPIDDPDRSTGQAYVWSPENCSWVPTGDIQPIYPYKNLLVDKIVRKDILIFLEKETSTLKECSDNNYLASYTQAWANYFKQLKNLLDKKELLRYSDLPPEPTSLFKTATEKRNAYNKFLHSVSFNSAKKEYEKYGVVCGLNEEFLDIFMPGIDWVKGNDPLPSGYFPISIDFRDR